MPKGLRTTAPKNGKIATFPKAVQGRADVSAAPASPDILSEIETEEGTETLRFVSNGQAKEAVAFQGNQSVRTELAESKARSAGKFSNTWIVNSCSHE
jgi:hypothetical protein